jgi:hypothetical protein
MVYVVYEPQDYQRANILGVYRNSGDAAKAWRDAQSEALVEA